MYERKKICPQFSGIELKSDNETTSIEYHSKLQADVKQSTPKNLFNENATEKSRMHAFQDETPMINKKNSNTETLSPKKTNGGKITVISDYSLGKSSPQVMVAESILVQPEENMIEQPISDDQSKDFLAILHKATIIYSLVSHEQLETPMVVSPEGDGVDLIKSHDREIPLVIVPPKDVVDLPIPEDQLIILKEIPYDPYNVDYIDEVPTPVERRQNTIMHSMEIVRDSTSQDEDLKSEAVHNSHKDIYHRSDGVCININIILSHEMRITL
ncbi:hypothetical protein JTB14_030289 [Gonioctena quinquepunctata]|nr:hypothetical protein JTB14_030289 [Gonioctena quinquepunctata]